MAFQFNEYWLIKVWEEITDIIISSMMYVSLNVALFYAVDTRPWKHKTGPISSVNHIQQTSNYLSIYRCVFLDSLQFFTKKLRPRIYKYMRFFHMNIQFNRSHVAEIIVIVLVSKDVKLSLNLIKYSIFHRFSPIELSSWVKMYYNEPKFTIYNIGNFDFFL